MGATIKDVAQLASVSVGTVSRYINGYNVSENSRQAIEKAIEELEFRVNPVARSLKTKRSMTVAVVVPSLANQFSMTIIESIEGYLNEKGYSIIVCNSRNDPQKELERLEFVHAKYIDGLVLMPVNTHGSKILGAIGDNTPVVLIDRLVDEHCCDAVVVDNVNAVYQAIEELIISGHQRIGMIGGPQSIYTAQERLLGYRRVLGDYGIEIQTRLVVEGDYTIDSGYKLMKKLLAMENRPTAIFISNYEMTIGAVAAIGDLGITVPDELSLIGFDHQELSSIIKPSVAVVMQPRVDIGYRAAELLYKRMSGDTTVFPRIIRLKTELLKGDSIQALHA